MCRPLPWPWSLANIIIEWDTAKLQYIFSQKFIFYYENYDSGLIMKHLPLDSLVIVDSTPNLKWFLVVLSIQKMPLFVPWVYPFA
jgi:hypothetical protein